MPPFGGAVNIETLLIKPNATLADIATSTMLPRIQLGKADDLVNIANKCGGAGPNDTSYCLLKQTVGKDGKGAQILDCLHAGGRNAQSVASCATAGLPDDQRRQIECFQANSRNTKALALCATCWKPKGYSCECCGSGELLGRCKNESRSGLSAEPPRQLDGCRSMHRWR
jgi:hypothetical protein